MPDEYYAAKLTVGTLPDLMLQALGHRDFPKSRVDRQIEVIADSLAALGAVTRRRSRQICRRERRREESEA